MKERMLSALRVSSIGIGTGSVGFAIFVIGVSVGKSLIAGFIIGGTVFLLLNAVACMLKWANSPES